MQAASSASTGASAQPKAAPALPPGVGGEGRVCAVPTAAWQGRMPTGALGWPSFHPFSASCGRSAPQPFPFRRPRSGALTTPLPPLPPPQVELVEPPEGAPCGERVMVPGYDGPADEQLNPKKKVFEQAREKGWGELCLSVVGGLSSGGMGSCATSLRRERQLVAMQFDPSLGTLRSFC
jgi:hypothetical protein